MYFYFTFLSQESANYIIDSFQPVVHCEPLIFFCAVELGTAVVTRLVQAQKQVIHNEFFRITEVKGGAKQGAGSLEPGPTPC